MDITPEQRERVYFEEKMRREGKGSSTLEILLVATAAIIGFTGFLVLASRPERSVKLEDLRKAYAGLAPEED